jgi:hypothetical protein
MALFNPEIDCGSGLRREFEVSNGMAWSVAKKT